MLELLYKGTEFAPLPKARHVDFERCYTALAGYIEAQLKKDEEAAAKAKEDLNKVEQIVRDTVKERVPGQMRP